MDGNEMEVLYVSLAIGLAVIILLRNAALEKKSSAITRIEAKVDLLMSQAGITFDPYKSVPPEVVESLKKRAKVEAIKRYRQLTGATLKESVDFVEEIQRRSGDGIS